MIQKQFVPYELALELKQLGFDEPCFTYYKNCQLSEILEVVKNNEMRNVNNEVDDYISAPTYSQAFRFFRENYHLIGGIQYIGGETPKTTWWDIYVVGHYNVDYKEMSMKYQPYEDAEKACLKKLIEIVKLNN